MSVSCNSIQVFKYSIALVAYHGYGEYHGSMAGAGDDADEGKEGLKCRAAKGREKVENCNKKNSLCCWEGKNVLFPCSWAS